MARNPGDIRALTFRALPGNDRCADCQDCDCEKCGFPDPVWASTELGILVCDECMSLHNSITKSEFKSILSTHEWTDDDWRKMDGKCNFDINDFYEAKLPPGYQKPTRCFHRAFREHFVTSKYIKKHFMQPEPGACTTLPAYLKIGEKTGYMWKRGRDDQMFHRRWFEFALQRAALVYYTDANKQNQRGEIPLNNVHVCLASEDKIRHPNGLQLILEEERQIRMIYLYADQEKDMVEWYQAICIVKFWVARHAARQRNEKIHDHELMLDLNTEVILEGSMMKTDGAAKRAFRKRWFILHGRTLMYFGHELDANPKKSVKLGTNRMGYSIILSGDYQPHWPQGGFPFLLKTPGRIFTFIANTEHERQAWYKALLRACRARQPDGHRHGPQPPPRPMGGASPPQNPALPGLPPRPLPDIPSRPGGVSPTSDVSGMRRDSLALPPLPGSEPRSAPNSPQAQARKRATRSLSADTSDGYIRPNTPEPHGDQPPVPPPRPIETLPEYNRGLRDPSPIPSDDESTEESDDPYVDMETVPVICVQVDSLGMCVKSRGVCLRIPQDAMDVAKGEKSFVSVTPLQAGCKEVAESDQPGINATGANVVDCRSFNYLKPLRKPMHLEIPHCAIIGDLAESTVKFWHKRCAIGTEDNVAWREILSDNHSISCRVKERCLQLTTLHMGSFSFLVDGPGVRGKAMQMAIFTRAAGDDLSKATAHIYLFNDISSDSVWSDIEEKELNQGSSLTEVSTSFCVFKDGGDLTLTFSEVDGLTVTGEYSNVVYIPMDELWRSTFVMLKVKFDVDEESGKANITLSQSDANGKEAWSEDAVFSYISDDHDYHYMTVESFTRQSHKSMGRSRVSITPADAEPDYLPIEFYPPPLRHSSARNFEKRKQSLRHQHQSVLLRSRRSPLSRTTPRIVCGTRGGLPGSAFEASSSSTPSETGSDSSGKTSGGAIPKRLKEDLSELLDSSAQFGNDWSMLAKYVGLEHLMHRFFASSHPTILVLECCEQFNYTLTYLEQAMRDIAREDAASLVRSYIFANACKED